MPETLFQTPFTEDVGDDASLERKALLQRRIVDLGLKIEGTRLERLVKQLYAELEEHGIDLKPPVYLADEWGCPEGIPLIGIPFYLADERLVRLQDEIMEGVEAETDDEIMRYLRHETGHAFNYAYRLLETEEWHEIFGPYSRPYLDDYKPNPFSRDFVRHISGWYAQKHPDEDFAESFAVWMLPGFDWRREYDGWGALRKLEYVDRIVRQVGRTAPTVTAEGYDSSGELDYSIAEHYERFGYETQKLPAYFDGDLRQLFDENRNAEGGGSAEPAAAFLRRHRRTIMRQIAYWTGVPEGDIRSLFDHFAERAEALALTLNRHDETALLTELTTYATTLCMNRLHQGEFVIKGDLSGRDK